MGWPAPCQPLAYDRTGHKGEPIMDVAVPEPLVIALSPIEDIRADSFEKPVMVHPAVEAVGDPDLGRYRCPRCRRWHQRCKRPGLVFLILLKSRPGRHAQPRIPKNFFAGPIVVSYSGQSTYVGARLGLL